MLIPARGLRHITQRGNNRQDVFFVDDDGTLLRKFIYGPGIDEPISMIVVSGQTETRCYYHFDGLGSVVALSNYNGDVAERYSYDVFGEPNRTSSIGNPYLFTGRQYDNETGLYYYRARYYNPAIGRFMQTDPIYYAAELNLYQYCANNPINMIDPFGDKWYKPWKWPKALWMYVKALVEGIKISCCPPAGDAGEACLKGGTTCLAYKQTLENIMNDPDFITDPNYEKLKKIAETPCRK